MKWAFPFLPPSIFGRTFLFMAMAFAATEAIEISLDVIEPPLRDPPVRLSQISAQLAAKASMPASDRGPDMGSSKSAADDALKNVVEIPPGRLYAHRSASAPPAPKSADMGVSHVLRSRLATVLSVPLESVQIYVNPNSLVPSTSSMEPWDVSLLSGFVAARRLANGEWLIVEGRRETFPTALQRRAIVLFALGLLLLLPVSWLFARALSAPICAFSDAAKRLGNDPAAPSLPRLGPAEMRDAVDSFNAMQARLNRLLQERTLMVGAIAHDLRTPLARLSFRLEDLPPHLREKVFADIQEMKVMISAALDFIRDRTLSARHEPLDFRLLVESVVDNHTDLGHDVTLQAGRSVTLMGDPLSLKRVVVNLVDNAVKYGERARLKLHADSQRCVLEVDDDGPGIAPELQRLIFHPFFRVESSRNRDTGGIGLGLTTVHSLITDHGGDVSVTNRKEGGLRVSVSLPMAG